MTKCEYCRRVARSVSATCGGCGAPLPVFEPSMIYDSQLIQHEGMAKLAKRFFQDVEGLLLRWGRISERKLVPLD